MLFQQDLEGTTESVGELNAKFSTAHRKATTSETKNAESCSD